MYSACAGKVTHGEAGLARSAARLFNVVFAAVFAAIAFAACGTKPAVVGDPQPEPEKGPLPPLIEMVHIPSGSFSMGSPESVASSLSIERPVHHVTIRGFLLGKYEVTQGQYFEVVGTRPSNFRTNLNDDSPDGWMKLPVEMVSWYEAVAFCNRLSIKEKLSPVYRIGGSVNPNDWGDPPQAETPAWNAIEMISGANGYRLPTEAEWEYAAKGGSGSPGNFRYAGHNAIDNVAWHYENSDFKIHEIGRKAPNGLGLHDMSGNVMEWCWDWHDDYTSRSQDNPTGPHRGMYRAIRGGAWSVSTHYARVEYRHNNLPSYRGVNLGFRVARSQ
jgi:formylglycine-generating enzyme required for sulfatase activity